MSDSTTDKYGALLESLQERAHLASLRADISDAFNSRGELDSVLQACTEALVRHLDASFARIWVLDKAGEILELRASAGIYTHRDGPHGRVKVGDFKIGRIALNLKPHVSNSVTTDPEVSNPEWARREGMISFAGYPLVMGDQAIGVIAFFSKHILSPDVVNELEPIATGIAQWIKRKQGEIALRQQQEWLNVTLRSIGDAVVATDTQGAVTFINSVAETLTGWKSHEALGQPLETVFHIVHEETKALVENPVVKALREKRIVGLSNHSVLLSKSGAATPIDDSASPIRDEKGEIIGVILVFHNITQRRQAEREKEEAFVKAEAARREAEVLVRVGRNLASELELSKVVQVTVEASRELSGAEFGAFFYNATGEEKDSFTNCVLAGITPEDLAALGLSRSTPLLASTFTGQRVHQVTTGQGGENPLQQLLAAAVISRSGSVLGGLFLGHAHPWKFSEQATRLVEGIAAQASSALDNSHLFGALAKAKVELTAQATILEERVRERTARLEEIVKSLEGVSYSIAHDLRGPLRSMEAYSSALLEDCAPELSDVAVGYAKKISSSAQRMDLLIKELLTYGQLTHQEIPLADVSADSVVASAIASLDAIVHQSRAEIEAAPLGMVQANGTILEQAMINLLTNAMKFVKPGEAPHIQISLERHQDRSRILVRDHGIGIEPHHQERIFKIFERLDPKNYPGTGIGLAVVQKSVERMGGSVGVDSHPGQGSTFWIDLPSVP